MTVLLVLHSHGCEWLIVWTPDFDYLKASFWRDSLSGDVALQFLLDNRPQALDFHQTCLLLYVYPNHLALLSFSLDFLHMSLFVLLL